MMKKSIKNIKTELIPVQHSVLPAPVWLPEWALRQDGRLTRQGI